jgi:hypothetical protein
LRTPSNTEAAHDSVGYSVDPDQLELTPLSAADGAARPEPVLLEVRLVGDEPGPGSAVTLGVGLLPLPVLGCAATALWWLRGAGTDE